MRTIAGVPGMVLLLLLNSSAKATSGRNLQDSESSGNTHWVKEKPTQLLELPRPAAEAFLSRGIQARERKQLDSAIDWFSKGLQRYSHHSDLRTELAMTQAWVGDFEDALRSFRRVLQEEPSHKGAYLGQARVLLWAGKRAEAKERYTRYLQGAPQSLEAMRGLAGVHLANLQLQDARRLYLRVLAARPHDSESLEGLERLQSIHLVRIEVQGGQFQFADTPRRLTGRIQASYRIEPEWTLYAGHGVRGFTLNRLTDDASSTTPSTMTEVGVQRGGSGVWNFDLGYQLQSQVQEVKHGANLRVGAKLGDQLSLLGGFRPALGARGNWDFLVDVGIQWLALPSVWAMLQNFQYRNAQQRFANVGVGTVNLALFDLCELRAGATWGVQDQLPARAVFAGLQINASLTYQLRLNYEQAFVPVERRAMHATWVVNL